MPIRKLFAVVLALSVLGAISAANSSATIKTVRAEFYKGPTPGTTVSEDLNLTASLGEHPGIGKKAKFAFKVAGAPFSFTAEEVECVGCKLTNKEVTSTAGVIAFGEGKLRFKKATVMEREGCTIKSETGVAGEVITKTLVFHADLMDTNSSNQKAFVQFIPAAGLTSSFAQYSVSGGECAPIEGTFKIVGEIYGESLNNTGVFSKTQGLVFSPSVLATAEGELNFETAPAELTMTINYSLASGSEFTIKP
jgi:hypothetical protein